MLLQQFKFHSRQIFQSYKKVKFLYNKTNKKAQHKKDIHTIHILQRQFSKCNGYQKSSQLKYHISSNIIIQALKMYFEIQNQSKIEVEFKLLNIFGKHSVICHNLKLKPEIVNAKDSLVHVDSCKISTLQIAIDSSKQQLLSAKVNGVKLVLVLNKNMQASTTKKQSQKPQIQQFKKLVSTQETQQKITYFEGSPFKKMIMQHILRKTSLVIENIDISLKYCDNPSPKYIGFCLSQLNIKQRLVINKRKNEQNHKQQQFQCKINNFSIYLGMQVENQIKLKQAFQKEIIKSSQNQIKKRFIMEENQISIYFNEASNTLSVMSELLEFNISAFYIKELMTMVKQINPLLSKAPKLRPGQGQKIVSGKYTFTQGTTEWWKFIGTSLVEKFKKKQQFNIIQNRQYKLYLYCLLYCYTYGREQNYINYIIDYQRFKKPLYIMSSHKFIIQKIYKIQNQKLQHYQELQLRGFVAFLSIRPRNQKSPTNNIKDLKNLFFKQSSKISFQKLANCNNNNIKKIKFEDIKKSNVFINFSNCIRFIDQYQKQSKKILNVYLNINSFKVNLIETNEQKKIYKQIYVQHPQHFLLIKENMVNSFYFDHMKAAQNRQDLYSNKQSLPSTPIQRLKGPNTKSKSRRSLSYAAVISLQIDQISLQKNQSGFSIKISHIRSSQLITKQKILDFKHLVIKNTMLERYSQKQGNIVNNGNLLELRLNSIFGNLTVKSVEKLLMVKTILSEDGSMSSSNNVNTKSQQQSTKDDFLQNFMKKKIISDHIFNTKQNQSIYILVQNICLVTSAFDGDKIFQINLNKIQFYYPLSQNKKISLQKIQVKRTTFQNIKNKSWKKLGQNESIILQNDRSFTGVISEKYTQKVNPKYFQYVKQFSKQKEKLKQQSPMIHHQASSIFNIIIPFLFIQLSCQDIYYIKLITKFWSQLFQNPYLFPTKIKIKQNIQDAHQNHKNKSAFQLMRQLEKNTNLLFQTHVKLDGIEFILNGDNPLSEEEDYSGQNRIMTLMVDAISYDSYEKLKKQEKSITVKNVYVRNLLGKDEFNFQALEDVFKQQIQKKDKLIRRYTSHANQFRNLIMYNHFAQDFQIQDKVPFFKFTSSTQMNIQKLQGYNNIDIKIKAFQIFHEPKFFRVIMQIFTRLSMIANKQYQDNRCNIFQKSFIKQNNQMRMYEQQQRLRHQTKQILYSKDFNVLNQISLQIQKINLIVLLQCEPIYCIALDKIFLNHKSQNYITVYNISITNFFIVDISQTNGPHNMIIESTKYPIKINYTQYNCELLKQRYKRSALMKIQIKEAKIHYLNKKIMEFIAFINQLKEDILGKSTPQRQQQTTQKKQDASSQYAFCYEIMVKDSLIYLYRNSLSRQKLNSFVSTIMVTNFRNKSAEQNIKRKSYQGSNMSTKQKFNLAPNTYSSRTPQQSYKTKIPGTQRFEFQIQNPNNQTLYQQIDQIEYDNFKSFIQQQVQEIDKNDNIYIDIYQLVIQGRHRDKQILVGDMHLTFHNIELDLHIPKLDMCLDNDDFRLLIRFTEQNFGEQDRYFHINPVLTAEKSQKFITKFFIQVIKMTCIKGDYGIYQGYDLGASQKQMKKQKHTNQELNILTIIQLAGRDVSYANGQKTDQITISQIFAQNQNMIQFIQKYNRTPNDPQIKVKPHKVQRSQQYFTQYKNIFDLFSKLGGQDADFVQSDFDQKNQQLAKKQYKNTGKGSKGQKLLKWFRGMCQKCFKLIKPDKQQINPLDIASAILKQKLHQRKKTQHMIQQHTLLCNGDSNCSHILDEKQIIRLQNKVTPQVFQPLYKPSYKNQIYFKMDMETTKEKKMYVLVKDMIMTYDLNKGLLDLVSFFTKPYGPYEDFDPQFVASNFNNFRPMQMYVEMKDSKMEMKKQFRRVQSQKFQKIDSIQKITILLDLIYNMQNLGDLSKGPGKSIKQADIIVQLYHTIQRSGKTQYIELSNLLEIIYRNQAKVSYKRKEKTRFDQNIIMKPFFDKQTALLFYLPAFYIKSLKEIYEHNFTKADIEQKQQTSFQKYNKNINVQSENIIKSQQNNALKQEKKDFKNKYQQIASKIDKKKQAIKQKNIQSSITNRKIYIPQLCINIESKIKSPFVKLKMNNFMMVNIYENKVRSQKSKIQISSQLSIDYWNLHYGDFEPFLQPWNMKMIFKNIKRQNTLSKKVKIQSFNNNPLNQYDSTQNPNSLNINISTSLFHTLKQLQLKYVQGKDQKQQQCIDVTFPQLEDFLNIDSRQKKNQIHNGFRNHKKRAHFPESMKNFFGRKFIIQSDAIRKKPQSKLQLFHQQGRIYNLYHSYFDHEKRKKIICYRTPFRLINLYNQSIKLIFKIKKKSSFKNKPQFIQREEILKKGQYFAIPSLVYLQDFLVKIKKHESKNKRKKSHQDQHKNALEMLNAEQQKILIHEEEDNFLSMQYLMQIYAQKNDFRKNKQSKILNLLFAQDNKKNRYIDPRDILIKVDRSVFALICTKSQYQNQKQKNSKISFYDTLVAIISPIQIFNNSPVPLTLILNGRKQFRIPRKKSTFINQDLNIENIHQTIIQFKEHILHRQFTFLKKQHENHTYFMEIDRMQSVNVQVIKQTTSTFSIEIFADWIIQNRTDEQFQLDYGTKLFPIDRMSSSSIAIQNYQHGKKIQMNLNIYSSDNSKQFPYNILTNGTQAVQIITMFKKVSSLSHDKIRNKKQQLKSQRSKCLCFKNYPFDQQTHQKQSRKVYHTYHFVVKISQQQDCKYTKKMTIMYKTKIKNKTNKILTLYQYKQDFKIVQIKPDEETCVWGYDFIPEHYFIGNKQFIDEKLMSNLPNQHKKLQKYSEMFKFDQSMGKTVTIKFKLPQRTNASQQVYHKYFQYLKMDIIQKDHSSLYEFTQISADSSDQFPIYIHNTTQENIKIYQNKEEFIVKPKSKVPFSWSDLVNNKHQIDVQIGDIKKTYSFKQNQQFQPLIIKDQIGPNINQPAIAQPKTNFHKQLCRIKYGLIEGRFQTIIDIKQMCLIILTGISGVQYKFDMKNAIKMTTSAQSIQLNLGPKQQPLIIYPSNQTYQIWLSYLNFTINQDIRTKISFTIETYKNSRLFFFHNVDLGRENDYLTSMQNYCIQNFYISIINEKPEEVLLIYCGDIRFMREDRICRLGYENYQIQKCDRKLQIKQIKINNQLQNAVNPVILTQIKKSKTPFISIITKKRNLVKSQQDLSEFQFKDQLITHYQSFRFFLDEAQSMVEASLIPKILNLKTQMEKIQLQYRIDQVKQQQEHLISGQQVQNKSSSKEQALSSYQLYLSFLEIRPIKMTISVSFDQLSKDQQERMNMYMLNYLPVGVENAIITIDSYMFHHIYQDKDQVMKQIREFYAGQLTKQVLVNAGNLQFLVAIDLVKGLGIGVKNIFYDPIYEFASKKDIKDTTSTLVEGLFSLVLFIISILVKILNLLFKMIAAFTFDTDYKAKRQIFRKQIFKSPLDGCIFGGKYFWKIFKSVYYDFLRFPKQYYEQYSVFGCLFGILKGLFNVIPWTFKIIVTVYDMLYVIGIGFVSWGHYEQNAMKTRSRPIRVFHKKKLVRYNLLQSKAYEILRQHNINLTEKQNILYVRDVDSAGKKSSYLILSDYSLLYCDNRLSIFDEIILYKIHTFTVIYPQNKQEKSLLTNNKKSVYLQIKLKSPNIRKILFIQFSKYIYKVKFKTYSQLVQLLQKLEQLKLKSQSSPSMNNLKQKYEYQIIDERRKYHKNQMREINLKNVPLEYKDMGYLDPSQNNILNHKDLNENFAQMKRQQI